MSAAIAGTGTREVVHYSSREILEWGKVPDYKKYAEGQLKMSQHKTSVRTGKPMGLWYAYDSEWHIHYKPKVNTNILIPANNKARQFDYKYVFDIPESKFTTSLEEDPSKILVLSLDNFKDFLVKFEAPGVKKIPKRYALQWIDFWHGLPKEYTYDRKELVGFDKKFAGIEFSQDLVEFAADAFKVNTGANSKKKITINVDTPEESNVPIDVSFLQYLEIRSGCLFHPETVLSGKPRDYLKEVKGAPLNTSTAGAASARRGGTRRFGKKRSVRWRYSRKARR